jgi:RNA polymerase sigma-70 factor (ECF subfamily)
MSLTQEDVIHGLLTDRARLLAYIRALVLDRDVAEDIHQEVVIEAFRAAESIVDGNHLLAWARRAAKLKACEHFRAQRRQPRHLDPDVLELLGPHWEAENGDSGQARAEALSVCLQELTPRSQELVRLRFRDDLSGSQIAEALHLKLHSVYVSLSRIYHALDDCVRRKLLADR